MDQQYLLIIIPLVAGYLLDLALGDPRWLPHPIRLFGHLISFGTKTLNRGKGRFLKGMILSVLLCAICWLFFAGMQFWLLRIQTPAF